MLAIYALQAFFSDTFKRSQKLILTDFSKNSKFAEEALS